MNVGELIEILSSFDEGTEVMFAYNYGDYWNTVVAEEVVSADEEEVTWSEYHKRNKVLEDEDRDCDLPLEIKTVVLLR